MSSGEAYSEAFGADVVLEDLRASTLNQVMDAALDALAEARAIPMGGLPALRKALRAREAAGATAVGNGVAMPHARVVAVRRLVLAVIRVKTPGLPPAPDGIPIRIVFCFLSPLSAGGHDHLILLQRISRAAQNTDWIHGALSAEGPGAFSRHLKTGGGRRPSSGG